MAAYCRVYDSCHLLADCQEPAPEPCARQSSMCYIYLFYDGETSPKWPVLWDIKPQHNRSINGLALWCCAGEAAAAGN